MNERGEFRPDLPSNFNERLDHFSRLKKDVEKNPERNSSHLELIMAMEQIRQLANGNDSEGVSKFYPGWTQDYFKELLNVLDWEEWDKNQEEAAGRRAAERPPMDPKYQRRRSE